MMEFPLNNIMRQIFLHKGANQHLLRGTMTRNLAQPCGGILKNYHVTFS